MISAEPLILISEFCQHVVIIVLAGYLIVEFFTTPAANHDRRREVLSLLFGVVATGGTIIGEYFITVDTVLQQMLYHIPVYLAGMFALSYLLHAGNHDARPAYRVLRMLFLLLFPLLGFQVAADIYSDTIQYLPWVEFMLAFLKTAQVAVLYFFILIYTIRMDEAEKAAYTVRHEG